MKYKWSLKKYWLHWLKKDLIRLIFKFIYKIKINSIPSLGKGKYVSVYTRLGIIIMKVEKDYIRELKYDEIRLVPLEYNHGVLVELWKDGKLSAANNMSIEQFQKNMIYSSNIESLTVKKNK